MALPENYLPRKGDILVIHATVKYDADSPDETLFLTAGATSLTFHLENVAAIRLRNWREGEKVCDRGDRDIFGEVLAQSGEHVWVKLAGGAKQRGSANGHRIYHCNQLFPMPSAPVFVTGMKVIGPGDDTGVIVSGSDPEPELVPPPIEGPKPLASGDEVVF